MKIEFTAYCADNFVHDLPGIQPCREMGEDDNAEDDFRHTVEFKDRATFNRQFYHWMELVRAEVIFVSGDDDYFDYFPGNIDAGTQIAKALKDPVTQKHWRSILQYCYTVRYYDLEPETIIPLEELPKYEKKRNKELSEVAEKFREIYWADRIANFR